MSEIIHRIEMAASGLPLPLLEVWGRFAYILGFALALYAFGGFTFRPGGNWGLGREWQAWDAKAMWCIPLTFLLIVVSGYAGSFIVLVPGAQTFESLKDLMVFLCVVLFGYPALLTVPFAYGLSDLIEGVPPSFLLAWLPGYFINPTCFWLAYQLFGKDPDFRRPRTWGIYALFVAVFMASEPVLWGYICAGKFTSRIAYGNIASALFFTTAITWLLAPLAMLAALPLARRFGMFWAEIPGHVREWSLSRKGWVWESGPAGARPAAIAPAGGWPIRMVILAPFSALVLALVGATAYLTLRSAEEDANKMATRLHEEVSDNINLRLDEYLDKAAPNAVSAAEIGALLKTLPIAHSGMGLVIDTKGAPIASSRPADDPVAANAIAAFLALPREAGRLDSGVLYRFDQITAKPLSRETWLARATAYQDRRGGHRDWIVLTVMPASYYLAGVKEGNSRSAMVFAIALLSALAVAAWLATLVTGRLRDISLATKALAGGDLSQTVPASRIEELGDLAQAFNDMARRRKLAEEYAARLASIVESSEDAIISEALDGRIQSWNRGAEKLFGHTAEEVLGKRMLLLYPPDRAGEEAEIIDRISRGKTVEIQETVRRTKNGGKVDVSATVSPIRDEGGRVTGASTIAHDITERKRSAEALRQRVEEVALRNAELERFNQASTDRELRILELKKEINGVLEKAGMPPKYRVDFPQAEATGQGA